MEKHPGLIEELLQIVVTVLVATFGALARQLNQKSEKPVSIVVYASNCFIGAFTGLVVYFVAAELGISPNIACAVAGACGWIGPQALDAILATVAKKVGVEVKKEDRADGDN